MKKILFRPSRTVWVSRLCLKEAKYAILTLFDAWKISKNYACPNFAPLFLKEFGLNKPKIIKDLVTIVVSSGYLTVKIVTFTIKLTVTAMLRVAHVLTKWRTKPTRLCLPFNPPPSPYQTSCFASSNVAAHFAWLTRLVVLFPTTTRLDVPLSWEIFHPDWNNQNQAVLFVSLRTRYKSTKLFIFCAWTFYQFLTVYWSEVTNFAT